ncbi:MAG: prepilin peptidase [Planctomycetes bacterium]|nr:prepilin peptidase [Planctomycetota bacterium]
MDMLVHGWLGPGLAVLLGLSVGSFANVAIYRLPLSGLSVMSPARSFCPSCRKTLAWSDNVPVASWIVLGRRCRYCSTPIPWRYPAVELLVGALFLLVWWRHPPEDGAALGRLAVYLAVTTCCVVISAIDLEHTIIPDAITLPGIALGLAASFALPGLHMTHAAWRASSPHTSSMIAGLLGALAGGGSLWLVGKVGNIFLRKRIEAAGVDDAMGLGDVKWMAFTGTVLGAESALLAILAACFIGALVGIVLKILAALRKRDDVVGIPFGPFLSAGVVVELLWPGSTWEVFQRILPVS